VVATEPESRRQANGGRGLTEVVNGHTGFIRARGYLTVRGADLLRGAVEALHRRGHARVTLDIRAVQEIDDAGLRMLRALQRQETAAGHELVLLGAPRPSGVG
jgi:anti-anti-sigma regulatory factor